VVLRQRNPHQLGMEFKRWRSCWERPVDYLPSLVVTDQILVVLSSGCD